MWCAGGVDESEVLVAVVVDVGDGDRGGAQRAQLRGEDARAVEEGAGAVVAEEKEGGLPPLPVAPTTRSSQPSLS